MTSTSCNGNRHAYLIMAHNQWEVLDQLLLALDDPRNDIYIHFDSKSCPPPRKHFCDLVSASRIYFTKRFNIVWGGTQMMECTIHMLEEAMKGHYSHYHFISGVDFPLKSQNDIHRYFEMQPNRQFVGFDWPGINSGRFLSRVQYYHFLINVIGKRDNPSLAHRLMARIEDLSLMIQSKLHIDRINYDMYKGSSWFSITHSAVLAIIAEKDKILKRFSFGANTDEIWLQTFLKNSRFSECIVESNMRYIKWVQGNPSPEILTMADYDDLCSTDMLFARKFDWNKDHEIILKLKEHISED